MVYKFTLLSDEADNFVRVINIDAESTFLDLNNAILDSVNFAKNQITSFFICTDGWEKGQEVTLMEMESSSEYDNLVMESTRLEELLEDEKQRLLYVFDMMTDRAFFMELTEILPGVHIDKADCVLSQGDAPVQLMSEEEFIANTKVTIDENFYGDEDYNIDELDEEGFGDMNFDDNTLFTDDPKY